MVLRTLCLVITRINCILLMSYVLSSCVIINSLIALFILRVILTLILLSEDSNILGLYLFNIHLIQLFMQTTHHQENFLNHLDKGSTRSYQMRSGNDPLMKIQQCIDSNNSLHRRCVLSLIVSSVALISSTISLIVSLINIS